MVWILGIVVVFVVALLVSSFRAVKKFTGRISDTTPASDVSKVPEYFREYVKQTQRAMPAIEKMTYTPITVTSFDGLRLSGKLYRIQPTNSKVVISFHGYHGNEYGDMARFFSLYQKLGLDILLITERAHSASEGSYITFGQNEQEDGITWIQKVIDLYGDSVEILLHGISMGASTVCLISGHANLPTNVKAIVSDCAYSSMVEQAHNVIQLPSILLDGFLVFMNFWTRCLEGFDIHNAAPIQAVAHSHTPTLFIHGTADKFVPYTMFQPLYDACSAPKQKFSVEGAGHACSYTVDPNGYDTEVVAFVRQYM